MADVGGLNAECQGLAPWYSGPLCRELGQTLRLLKQSDGLEIANRLAQERNIRTSQGLKIRFRLSEPQEPIAYELGIALTGEIPCRAESKGFTQPEALHDLLNALVWLFFPLSKARLNELQAHEIERAGQKPAARGPVRDGITTVDENALLLLCPHGKLASLTERRWQELFVKERSRWHQEWLALPFGHALMQKLENPFPAITAHVLLLELPQVGISSELVDRILAAKLTAEWISSKPFFPMPVLGIPGWLAQNEDPEFYNNQEIFRPLPISTVVR